MQWHFNICRNDQMTGQKNESEHASMARKLTHVSQDSRFHFLSWSLSLMRTFTCTCTCTRTHTHTHRAAVLSGRHQQTAGGTLFIPKRDVLSVTDRHKYPITPSARLMCADQIALKQGNRDVQQTANISHMNKSTGTHATLSQPSLHAEYSRAEKHCGAEILLNIGRCSTESTDTCTNVWSPTCLGI